MAYGWKQLHRRAGENETCVEWWEWSALRRQKEHVPKRSGGQQEQSAQKECGCTPKLGQEGKECQWYPGGRGWHCRPTAGG